MLSNLRLRTKLAALVAVPLIAALAAAIPGIRSRQQDLDAIEQAQHLVAPIAEVRAAGIRIADEASLSAWWLGTGDRSVEARLAQARTETDIAVTKLRSAERAAGAAGAAAAAARIHDLREAASLMGQQRQFVDLRIANDSALVEYRTLVDTAAGGLDALARAPRRPLAALLFRDQATFARLGAALADERGILALAYGRNALTNALASDLSAASTRQKVAIDSLAQGHPATVGALTQAQSALRTVGDDVRRRRSSALTQRLLPDTIDPAEWFAASTAQLDQWRKVEQSVATRTNDLLEAKHRDSRSGLIWVAGGSAAVLLLAGVIAWLLARATTRPLRRLADNANYVATTQLPALVATLQDPEAPLPLITPLTVSTRDELGDLARAFNRVERTTVEVAELQRAAVRTGISELYVNLARRNQPLLEQQVEVIERLEADERDPNRLDAYFTLDHLATRIRRNADSLLVLAGVAQDEGRRVPVELLDVVRGAASECAEFRRIDIAAVPSVLAIKGYAASDLAHLLAELLDNATTYSPSGTRVTVMTHPAEHGLEITVSDQGIGIPPDRVASLNAVLEAPPAPGLVHSRSLGLVVVGRLAQRIGVSVTLRSARDVGTAATVGVPSRLITDAERSVVDLSAAEAGDTDSALVDVPAPQSESQRPAHVPTPALLRPVASPDATHLPQRTPPEAQRLADRGLETPPQRAPEAVFELVARYETGRQRAREAAPRADDSSVANDSDESDAGPDAEASRGDDT